MLPLALSKLGSQFAVNVLKTIEPVYTGNKNSPFYMPDLSHYSGEKEIDRIPNFLRREWQDKVKSYCETDCISLFQIMIKFLRRRRSLVFDKWGLFLRRRRN